MDGGFGSVTAVLDDAQARQARAASWFRELRDAICARFLELEDALESGPDVGRSAGTFERTPTERHSEDGSDGGGGEMSVMRGGRVFEKVGVNISTVHGELAPRAQKMMASRGSGAYEHADVLDPECVVVWRRR